MVMTHLYDLILQLPQFYIYLAVTMPCSHAISTCFWYGAHLACIQRI